MNLTDISNKYNINFNDSDKSLEIELIKIYNSRVLSFENHIKTYSEW
jgi:hypothetical protein